MARFGAAALAVSVVLGLVGTAVLAQIMGPGAKAHVETDPTGSIFVDLTNNVSVAEGNPRLVYEGENQRGTLSARKVTFKMAEGTGVTDLTAEGATEFDWTMPGPKRNGQPTKRHLSGHCSRGATYQVKADGDQNAEIVTLNGDAYCRVEMLPDPEKSEQFVLTGDKIVYDMTAGTVITPGAGEVRPRLEIILPPKEEKPGESAPESKGPGE